MGECRNGGPSFISTLYPLPIIHAIQWGANGRKQNEKGRRKKGNEGEERDGTKAAPQPQSAKISPKGRKTSRVNTRENAELLNLGVNQEGPTFQITTNSAAASDACDTHQRNPSPTHFMYASHKIKVPVPLPTIQHLIQ